MINKLNDNQMMTAYHIIKISIGVVVNEVPSCVISVYTVRIRSPFFYLAYNTSKYTCCNVYIIVVK